MTPVILTSIYAIVWVIAFIAIGICEKLNRNPNTGFIIFIVAAIWPLILIAWKVVLGIIILILLIGGLLWLGNCIGEQIAKRSDK